MQLTSKTSNDRQVNKCSVEAILGIKFDKEIQQPCYKVKWQGEYPEYSWVPSSRLSGCAELIRDFAEQLVKDNPDRLLSDILRNDSTEGVVICSSVATQTEEEATR